jgi:hypothetical protein
MALNFALKAGQVPTSLNLLGLVAPALGPLGLGPVG